MRLWQQRSSNATMALPPVRHSTSGFSATTWPLRAPTGNSSDSPATYQAFLTRTLAITVSSRTFARVFGATMGRPARQRQATAGAGVGAGVGAGAGARLRGRPGPGEPRPGGCGQGVAAG